jgi:hypothetical protein
MPHQSRPDRTEVYVTLPFATDSWFFNDSFAIQVTSLLILDARFSILIMSFGFSVGDLIRAANLTYRLIKALHGSQDAGHEYRDAINELGCLQQALIRVSCLGANHNVSRATLESASCIIMGSMDIIRFFLDKTKKYDRRLGGFAPSGLANNLRKVGGRCSRLKT